MDSGTAWVVKLSSALEMDNFELIQTEITQDTVIQTTLSEAVIES